MPIRAAVIMVLTFVFGIVPATLLVPFALVMGAVGIYALFVVDEAGRALLSLLLIAAAVLSVYGYVALFHAAGDAVTPRVAWWLGAGIIANAIGIGLLGERMRWFALDDWFLFLAPLVVGCAHLIRFAVKRLPVRSRC
jgi:hypothetical protein